MKIEKCPKCLEYRLNNSPASYVWWHVMGHGYMCWKCYDKLEKEKKENEGK
tara:strand:+ start:1084 stop:1236 length:153 start_codon:yes stop_codon:yes gene_type:complete